ncbi:MAG: hypothetical protein DMG07_25370 [Acidobacteria bacterium]|nr:MAG: hypothetical protein DMG07_25370 [Acidobacteriota bacterium]
MISTTMRAGERVYHRQPGGGGWGDPHLRPVEAVVRDVSDGKLSAAAARAEYGVALDETTLEVDDAATARLRARCGS